MMHYGKKHGGKHHGKKHHGGKKSMSVHGYGKRPKVSGIAGEMCAGHCDMEGPKTSKGGMPANETHK